MRNDILIDIIFTSLVLIVMASMKVPKRGTLPSVFHNITFWIYVGYWFKTFSTIARIPIVYTNSQDSVHIMIWFNWSGSFIATLSTVLPCNFVHHYLKHSAFTSMSMFGRLAGCLFVVLLYCLALLACVVVIATEVTTAETVLFVWRVFFFANAGLESAMIFWSLIIIRQHSKDRSKSRNTQRHLVITLYMRGGIAGTIVLKLKSVFSAETLAIIHLWFILTGLFAYHLRVLSSNKRFYISITNLFRRTDQALVAEPLNVEQRKQTPQPIKPIAMFGSPHQQHSHSTMNEGALGRPASPLGALQEAPSEIEIS
eukprot:c2354_g1_i2.p1 GENE.c2354_g1_i2~~c2354_g1_i2.p1  ORF type:complete len:344 (+),score=57.64 c2354_g1_i2:96-1034(+)